MMKPTVSPHHHHRLESCRGMQTVALHGVQHPPQEDKIRNSENDGSRLPQQTHSSSTPCRGELLIEETIDVKRRSFKAIQEAKKQAVQNWSSLGSLPGPPAYINARGSMTSMVSDLSTCREDDGRIGAWMQFQKEDTGLMRNVEEIRTEKIELVCPEDKDKIQCDALESATLPVKDIQVNQCESLVQDDINSKRRAKSWAVGMQANTISLRHQSSLDTDTDVTEGRSKMDQLGTVDMEDIDLDSVKKLNSTHNQSKPKETSPKSTTEADRPQTNSHNTQSTSESYVRMLEIEVISLKIKLAQAQCHIDENLHQANKEQITSREIKEQLENQVSTLKLENERLKGELHQQREENMHLKLVSSHKSKIWSFVT